jgi:hypothetical protein
MSLFSATVRAGLSRLLLGGRFFVPSETIASRAYWAVAARASSATRGSVLERAPDDAVRVAPQGQRSSPGPDSRQVRAANHLAANDASRSGARRPTAPILEAMLDGDQALRAPLTMDDRAEVSGGLTIVELRAGSPAPAKVQAVLIDELRLGRVERQGNRWRLVSGAFAPDLLEALARFGT